MSEWKSIAISKSINTFRPPRFFIDGEEVMDRAFEASTQDNYTKVRTSELLNKLKENRAIHDAEWEEAHGKWRSFQTGKMRAYLAALQTAIESAESGGKISFPHQRDFMLEEPKSHVAEYDKVIARMTMTVDETIHISHEDFDHYVLDDWSWKRQFAATNSIYNG